jgi:hypothetical protein
MKEKIILSNLREVSDPQRNEKLLGLYRTIQQGTVVDMVRDGERINRMKTIVESQTIEAKNALEEVIGEVAPLLHRSVQHVIGLRNVNIPIGSQDYEDMYMVANMAFIEGIYHRKEGITESAITYPYRWARNEVSLWINKNYGVFPIWTEEDKRYNKIEAYLKSFKENELPIPDSNLICAELGIRKSTLFSFYEKNQLPLEIDFLFDGEADELGLDEVLCYEDSYEISELDIDKLVGEEIIGELKTQLDFLLTRGKNYHANILSRDLIIIEKLLMGKNAMDIAKELGISKQAIYNNQLPRARRRFAKTLFELGYEDVFPKIAKKNEQSI